ncbi:MAG: discoidin domain-containing protein [Burkholderiales bacterium]|nr:discoidin domain-containing protein [Burkholderiales bacterium]
MRGRRRCLGLGAAVLAGSAMAANATPQVLDDFKSPAAWTATASDQVQARVKPAGANGGLCLAYDFAGVSGYAVARRAIAFDLPAHYELALRVRGSGGPNDVQLKLLDASGDNVWWVHQPNRVLPTAFSDWRVKQRDVQFAWGPSADKTLRQVAAIELAVAAGKAGGKGEICLEKLNLVPRETPPATWPQPAATANKSLPEAAPELAVDGKADTAWRSPPGAALWQVDLGAAREFSGLVLRWATPQRPTDYDLEASDNGRRWTQLRHVRDGEGAADWLYLPDAEARHIRLRIPRSAGKGAALQELQLIAPGAWKTRDDMLKAVAAEAPRGQVPRAYLNEQNYWALVGVDGGGSRSGLMSEDGAVEAGLGGFSIEPTLRIAGEASLNWANVEMRHSLREGYLPMPSVFWQHPLADLRVEAAADGPPKAPRLLVRYTVTAPPGQPLKGQLVLGLRPWQVNPPQQFLNTPGGVVEVRELAWKDAVLQVNGRAALQTLPAPAQVELRGLDSGLAQGEASDRTAALRDRQAMASGALSFALDLAPGASQTVVVELPLAGDALAAATPLDASKAGARFDAVASAWRERLNRVQFTLPSSAKHLSDKLRSALAQILMSRDGPALQPGTRSYQRSWIRDGAMMVEGLLRLGEVQASADFVNWYGEHLFANGKVPCCVDARGADPVAENDSHGQFIHAVALLWQFTGDKALLAKQWPRVLSATRYMEQLRQSEHSEANKQPGREALWGTMPASISHEGYSDKPMHSYWDDFWALRGYKDAVLLAQAADKADDAKQIKAWRDEFQAELVQSIAAAMKQHGKTFIPGAAELGDFDATSTTVALSPAQADDVLPPEWLSATFERYWQEATARRDGKREWKDYTPYELRSVGALLRLGQPERAWAMLDFFFKDQRPEGWNQWAEVVMRNPREVHFLGDMPHAWVSSDFMRSALDLFAYERERDHSLVLGAGLKAEWLQSASGVAVKGLLTATGTLDYALTPQHEGWQLEIGSGVNAPSGGFRLVWPVGLPLPDVALPDGRVLAWQGRELNLPGDVRQVQLSKAAAPAITKP